jgi:hypothetical protein
MRLAVWLLAVAAGTPVWAQIGYPGQYPGYPGQGRGNDGPPRLSRNPKQDAPAASDKLTRTSGIIRKIDDTSVVIEASDGRVLDCKRSAQTRFYKDSHEIQASDLHPGDRVSVEASQDDRGYFYARNVYFEKAAAAAPSQQADPGGNEPATVVRDKPDLHPPELRRGRPANEGSASDDEDTAASAPPRTPAAAPPNADPTIEKARAAAVSFSQKLPNYICREFMTRYVSQSQPASWKAQDVVSTDVVYEDGAEKYGNVQIDGKPVHKQLDQLNGSWSTGEFGTVLRDLFATGAEFHFSRYSNAGGFDARVYDFDVARANSHWQISVASQSILPAYHGSVWIDPQTGHVLRIEMQAKALPGEFPLDTVESAIDYAYVRIGEGEFLLPSHAESLACRRGTSDCSRNTIDFRNYRKYEAKSQITF